MIKILLAYNHMAWRNAHYYQEKFFQGPDREVFLADLEQTPYWTNWNQKLPFYFPKGRPVSVKSLEEKHKTKFDLIVEIDGTGQYHLSGMRGVKTPKVLWSMDTHVQSKQNFQLFCEKDYDFAFSCHKDKVSVFKKAQAAWLPVAFDPAFHRKMDVPKTMEVAFVGNADPKVYPERVRLLDRLAKKFKVSVFHKVYGDDMIKIFNQAKIVFNRSLSGDLSMRVFEVLGTGSMLITDRSESGVQDLFQDGKHLAMYGSAEELEEKVAHYLSRDAEREAVALAGTQEAHAKHTFYHRAQTIIDTVLKRS